MKPIPRSGIILWHFYQYIWHIYFSLQACRFAFIEANLPASSQMVLQLLQALGENRLLFALDSPLSGGMRESSACPAKHAGNQLIPNEGIENMFSESYYIILDIDVNNVLKPTAVYLLCKCSKTLPSHTGTSSKSISSLTVLPWFYTQSDFWWLRMDSFHSRPALNYINIIAMQVHIQGSGLKIWLLLYYTTLFSLHRSLYRLIKSLSTTDAFRVQDGQFSINNYSF